MVKLSPARRQNRVLFPADATYYLRTKIAQNNYERKAEKNADTEEKCARREYMIIENVPTSIVKHQWFIGKIVACQAIDQGSIPGRCKIISAHKKCENYYQRIAEKRAPRQKCARREKFMITEYVPTSIVKYRWFSGRIVACHAIDPGSIPGPCNLLSAHDKCAYYYQRIAEKNAHADKTAHSEENAQAKRNMIREDVPTSTFKHRWFSGKVVACHAIDPGSIDPADAIIICASKLFSRPYLPLETNCHSMANGRISRLVIYIKP